MTAALLPLGFPKNLRRFGSFVHGRNKMSKTILGIDPGSRVMNCAVLSEDRGKLIALRCDVIRLVHIENHLDRLNVIFDKVTNVEIYKSE